MSLMSNKMAEKDTKEEILKVGNPSFFLLVPNKDLKIKCLLRRLNRL